ncbi:MAG: hypothetical protein KDB26_02675 [Microthrixaceae bacterium]|nr:hypothetical protein [Microthrixaceae bacterium]
MPDPTQPVEVNSNALASAVTPAATRLRRQSRSFRLVIGLLGALMVLAGCSSAMRQPTDYGDINAKGEGFYGNFMYGCTGVQPTDGKYTNAKLGSEDFCKCIFTGLKKTVDFSDVRDFEEAQADADEDNPPTVPKGIEKVRKDCAEEHRA